MYLPWTGNYYMSRIPEEDENELSLNVRIAVLVFIVLMGAVLGAVLSSG